MCKYILSFTVRFINQKLDKYYKVIFKSVLLIEIFIFLCKNNKTNTSRVEQFAMKKLSVSHIYLFHYNVYTTVHYLYMDEYILYLY